jgi:uncharacterized protein (DUF433 family)
MSGSSEILRCMTHYQWNIEIMNSPFRITIDPNVCHGKPTIRGLRYPVETILEMLSSGMTTDEILADYEDLEPEDILAALAYARRISQIQFA